MKDAKNTEKKSRDTTYTIPANDHPLTENSRETAAELPPKYDEVRIEPTSTNRNATPVTPAVVVTSFQPQFGAMPVQCTCPKCGQNVVSRVEATNGAVVWIGVLILVLVGCWFGCCLIPLCIDDLKDKTHYCPRCGTILGTKKFF